MIRHQGHQMAASAQGSVSEEHRETFVRAAPDTVSTELPSTVVMEKGHNRLSGSIIIFAIGVVCFATLRLMLRRPSEEPLDILSVILLCAAYVAIAAASDIFVKWEAQSNNGILPFAPARMVFVVEVLKFCLTIPLVLMRYMSNSFQFPSKAECLVAMRLMSIPAISYSMNNAIVFFIVAHVDFSSLSVWRQLTPIFVAFIWILVFRRHLGRQRWLAIALLIAGTTLNSLSQNQGLRINSMIVVVLFSCLTTAVAGVANEYVLKRCGAMDIDFLCVLLYVQTSAFSLLLVVSSEMRLAGNATHVATVGTLLGGPPLVQDARPLVIMFLQVLFGFAVARVIRYLGSVPRAIVNAIKELTVVIVAPAFIDSSLNSTIMLSVGIVGGAAALFTLAPSPLPKASTLGKAWSPPKDASNKGVQ